MCECVCVFVCLQLISRDEKLGNHIFRLTGPGADQDPKGLFTIDIDTGDVSVTRSLDREAIDSYQVCVCVCVLVCVCVCVCARAQAHMALLDLVLIVSECMCTFLSFQATWARFESLSDSVTDLLFPCQCQCTVPVLFISFSIRPSNS